MFPDHLGENNMGHKVEISKLDVQKDYLKDIFVEMLNTNIAIMRFQCTLTDKKDEKKGLENIISNTKKAIEIVKKIKHYEILVSLYNRYINSKEVYFISFCGTILNEKTTYWDTEIGFKEFLEEEKAAIEEYNKQLKEKKEQADTIRKAKEEGKKVEMLYKDGKIQPVIVEEKPN